MPRKQKQPIEIPEGFRLGAEFDISAWYGHELVIDLSGEVHCYLGFLKDPQPVQLPYYALSVALHEKDGRRSHRFVRLQGGMLRKASFLRDDTYYKLLDDHRLVFPRGAESYFGVVAKDGYTQNADLTRQVFGGTEADIESVAKAVSGVTGLTFHEMLRLPRVTFSKSRENSCDISGALIPSNFPYLAFNDSQAEWGHVSLYSFYRLLAFLCPHGRTSPVRNALHESGVSDEVLDRLLKCAQQYGEPLRGPELW